MKNYLGKEALDLLAKRNQTKSREERKNREKIERKRGVWIAIFMVLAVVIMSLDAFTHLAVVIGLLLLALFSVLKCIQYGVFDEEEGE